MNKVKKFKCRTFGADGDNVTFDYGKEHILVTIETDHKSKFRETKSLSVCLNDKDIDDLIRYLMHVRGIKI